MSLSIIELSPQLLTVIQPDSSSYMNPSQNRQSLYYLLITLLNKVGINIILFQKILLSLSIVSITMFIGRKTSLLLGLISYSLIILNTYYISYSKTILPESILFSLLNLAIVYLFKEKGNGLVIFALICGVMASLKPIGIFISLILFIIFFIKNKKTHKIFIFLIFFLSPTLLKILSFTASIKKEQQSLNNQLLVN